MTAETACPPTENEPCTGCGRTDYVAAAVTDYGDRFCATCMRQPATTTKERSAP